MAKILLADVLEQAERYEQANDLYRAVPGTSPLYEAAQIGIAVNLGRLDKVDEAVDLLRR